jgi:phosphate uptake regulator
MKVMADEFMKMLSTTNEMMGIVRPHVFDDTLSLDDRRKVYKLDVKVNRLERSVRKRVVSHLALTKQDIPYCLLMMTLVKDAERIGDYVKNLSEVGELGGGTLPGGDLRRELEDLVEMADTLFAETANIIKEQNKARAVALIEEGRTAGKRCDRLLVELAKSDLTAAQATRMVLVTRFYKRIGGHLVNILSSVVMPLHKVDFFDEREIPELTQERE